MIHAQTLKQQQTRCDNARLCPFANKMMKKIISYLKYSGLSIILTVNPFHWRTIPNFSKEKEFSNYTYTFSFLFLNIRFWIDDGAW